MITATDSLFQAYAPLLIWTGLGAVLFRFIPGAFPRFLGRSLYWVGVPMQIFTLSRQSDWSREVGLSPAIALGALLGGVLVAWLVLQWRRRRVNPASAEGEEGSESPWQNAARRGSFLLSAIIGNTGFVGLAVVPAFIPEDDLSWVVFYSITNNVVGTYGIGVFLASVYGRSQGKQNWLIQVRDVLTVPSLWAFVLGSLTHSLPLPQGVERGLDLSLLLVIPSALLLMGIRLRQIEGYRGLQLAIAPTLLKVVVIPLLVGLATLALGLAPNPRLAIVLMSGMPSAFAGLILAEEYELDRELIASGILLSTLLLFITIPIWLILFPVPLPSPLGFPTPPVRLSL